jgi:hypothetical protein
MFGGPAAEPISNVQAVVILDGQVDGNRCLMMAAWKRAP